MSSKDHLNLLRKFANSFLDKPILRKMIPNTKGFPEIVYKYRQWDNENHQKLLSENELYMAPAKMFNDPFDGKIYKNYYLLDTPKKIQEHINKAMVKHNDWIIKNQKNPEEMRKTLEGHTADLTMYQSRAEYYDDDYNNKYHGTACFSKTWNSILMWSHYANNHKGFCVGFDQKRMEISGLFGKHDFVEYVDNYPIIHPDENDSKAQVMRIYTKHRQWEYEEEYRLMNLYFDIGGADSNSDNRKVKFPDNFVREIILGACMENEHKERIIEIARKRNINIYQAEKIPFKFEINRYQI